MGRGYWCWNLHNWNKPDNKKNTPYHQTKALGISLEINIPTSWNLPIHVPNKKIPLAWPWYAWYIGPPLTNRRVICDIRFDPYGKWPTTRWHKLPLTLCRQSCACRWPSTTTWWRHQMERFSTLLAVCDGNSPVTSEFPSQRPVTRSFDVFFDLRLNKRLSKHSRFGDFRRHRAHYDVTMMSRVGINDGYMLVSYM